MLRGENGLSAPFMLAGAWVEYGKKFNAMLFQLEHRYYGQSMPTRYFYLKAQLVYSFTILTHIAIKNTI